MSTAAKPTPYEIASLAALLWRRDGSHHSTVPAEIIAQACELWAAAAKHLSEADGSGHEWMMKNLGYKTFSFEEVLKPLATQKNRAKKSHTMVGSITTREGLIKALRRVFPNRADQMNTRGELLQYEIDAILNDQAKRNQNRIQAATAKRRTKSVNRKR